jgi:hypothetical protein
MKDDRQIFILINKRPLKDSPSHVRIALKDTKGKTVKKIEEYALLSDKNFRDLSGLIIGLKEAISLGIGKILILTNNAFVGIMVKNGPGEGYVDYYGFYPDIKRLISGFEEVGVKVVGD